MENRIAEALNNGEFLVTYELIPGRGAVEDSQAHFIEEAKEVGENKRIHGISITDNPSGNPALLADKFGTEILELGITPLVHFTCKDRSRNQIESQLSALERTGIQNILCMTGDYPISGWEGTSKPNFDLDSVQLIQMAKAMNDGFSWTARGKLVQMKQTHFFCGAVVNPFKWTEGEAIPQYAKLYKKCVAGADFFISQIGFDARKMQELIQVMREDGFGHIPVIANIFVLPYGVGKSMAAGNFPGCYVSPAMLAVLAEEAKAADKGKQARFIRAAKMIAIAKGLGYRGVHIGGIGLTPQVAADILDMAEGYEATWEDCARELNYGEPGCFYLYEQDPVTLLNSNVRTKLSPAKKDGGVQKTYKLARVFHKFMFVPEKNAFPYVQKWMYKKEQKHGIHRHHPIEHTGKSFLFGCMDCGDCGLPSTTYICPMTQCVKCQRNGPCGGSHDGWCEVFPNERYCIWYRAYHRYHRYGEEWKLRGYIAPPNNWDLFGGSPWQAYFLGNDNIQRRKYLDMRLMDETPVKYSVKLKQQEAKRMAKHEAAMEAKKAKLAAKAGKKVIKEPHDYKITEAPAQAAQAVEQVAEAPKE